MKTQISIPTNSAVTKTENNPSSQALSRPPKPVLHTLFRLLPDGDHYNQDSDWIRDSSYSLLDEQDGICLWKCSVRVGSNSNPVRFCSIAEGQEHGTSQQLLDDFLRDLEEQNC